LANSFKQASGTESREGYYNGGVLYLVGLPRSAWQLLLALHSLVSEPYKKAFLRPFETGMETGLTRETSSAGAK